MNRLRQMLCYDNASIIDLWTVRTNEDVLDTHSVREASFCEDVRRLRPNSRNSRNMVGLGFV